MKNIYLENFLQLIIKASVVEFIFVKIPCFLHILLNTFRQILKKYESYSLKGILLLTFTQHSGSCLKLEKPHCKFFWWEYIKNEGHKFYFGNKELKAISLDHGCFLVLCTCFCMPYQTHQWNFALERWGTIKLHFSRADSTSTTKFDLLWVKIFKQITLKGQNIPKNVLFNGFNFHRERNLQHFMYSSILFVFYGGLMSNFNEGKNIDIC